MSAFVNKIKDAVHDKRNDNNAEHTTTGYDAAKPRTHVEGSQHVGDTSPTHQESADHYGYAGAGAGAGAGANTEAPKYGTTDKYAEHRHRDVKPTHPLNQAAAAAQGQTHNQHGQTQTGHGLGQGHHTQGQGLASSTVDPMHRAPGTSSTGQHRGPDDKLSSSTVDPTGMRSEHRDRDRDHKLGGAAGTGAAALGGAGLGAAGLAHASDKHTEKQTLGTNTQDRGTNAHHGLDSNVPGDHHGTRGVASGTTGTTGTPGAEFPRGISSAQSHPTTSHQQDHRDNTDLGFGTTSFAPSNTQQNRPEHMTTNTTTDKHSGFGLSHHQKMSERGNEGPAAAALGAAGLGAGGYAAHKHNQQSDASRDQQFDTTTGRHFDPSSGRHTDHTSGVHNSTSTGTHHPSTGPVGALGAEGHDGDTTRHHFRNNTNNSHQSGVPTGVGAATLSGADSGKALDSHHDQTKSGQPFRAEQLGTSTQAGGLTGNRDFPAGHQQHRQPKDMSGLHEPSSTQSNRTAGDKDTESHSLRNAGLGAAGLGGAAYAGHKLGDRENHSSAGTHNSSMTGTHNNVVTGTHNNGLTDTPNQGVTGTTTGTHNAGLGSHGQYQRRDIEDEHFGARNAPGQVQGSHIQENKIPGSHPHPSTDSERKSYAAPAAMGAGAGAAGVGAAAYAANRTKNHEKEHPVTTTRETTTTTTSTQEKPGLAERLKETFFGTAAGSRVEDKKREHEAKKAGKLQRKEQRKQAGVVDDSSSASSSTSPSSSDAEGKHGAAAGGGVAATLKAKKEKQKHKVKEHTPKTAEHQQKQQYQQQQPLASDNAEARQRGALDNNNSAAYGAAGLGAAGLAGAGAATAFRNHHDAKEQERLGNRDLREDQDLRHGGIGSVGATNAREHDMHHTSGAGVRSAGLAGSTAGTTAGDAGFAGTGLAGQERGRNVLRKNPDGTPRDASSSSSSSASSSDGDATGTKNPLKKHKEHKIRKEQKQHRNAAVIPGAFPNDSREAIYHGTTGTTGAATDQTHPALRNEQDDHKKGGLAGVGAAVTGAGAAAVHKLKGDKDHPATTTTNSSAGFANQRDSNEWHSQQNRSESISSHGSVGHQPHHEGSAPRGSKFDQGLDEVALLQQQREQGAPLDRGHQNLTSAAANPTGTGPQSSSLGHSDFHQTDPSHPDRIQEQGDAHDPARKASHPLTLTSHTRPDFHHRDAAREANAAGGLSGNVNPRDTAQVTPSQMRDHLGQDIVVPIEEREKHGHVSGPKH